MFLIFNFLTKFSEQNIELKRKNEKVIIQCNKTHVFYVLPCQTVRKIHKRKTGTSKPSSSKLRKTVARWTSRDFNEWLIFINKPLVIHVPPTSPPPPPLHQPENCSRSRNFDKYIQFFVRLVGRDWRQLPQYRDEYLCTYRLVFLQIFLIEMWFQVL